MLEVDFRMFNEDRVLKLTLQGHADGEEDSGIVCAAASIQAYTVAQFIYASETHGELECEPFVSLKPGAVRIVCKAIDDDSYGELARVFLYALTAYRLLAINFPGKVTIISDDTGE